MASKKKVTNGSWWMLRNSGGKKDAVLTFMTIAFLFTLGLATLGAIETLSIATYAISFRAFDMGFATTVLIPLLMTYFGRRYSDAQRGLYDQQKLFIKPSDSKPQEDEQPE